MVLPGGPSAKCHSNDGHTIEPGDLVAAIDGVAIDKLTIVERLRGCDLVLECRLLVGKGWEGEVQPAAPNANTGNVCARLHARRCDLPGSKVAVTVQKRQCKEVTSLTR
jgi:hypothetical protein